MKDDIQSAKSKAEKAEKAEKKAGDINSENLKLVEKISLLKRSTSRGSWINAMRSEAPKKTLMSLGWSLFKQHIKLRSKL